MEYLRLEDNRLLLRLWGLREELLLLVVVCAINILVALLLDLLKLFEGILLVLVDLMSVLLVLLMLHFLYMLEHSVGLLYFLFDFAAVGPVLRHRRMHLEF